MKIKKRVKVITGEKRPFPQTKGVLHHSGERRKVIIKNTDELSKREFFKKKGKKK